MMLDIDWSKWCLIGLVAVVVVLIAVFGASAYHEWRHCESIGGVPVYTGKFGVMLCLNPEAIKK